MSQFSNTTYQNYSSFPAIWIPDSGNQSLLMVKLSGGTAEIPERDYIQLMSLRIQWMIHHWMEQSGEDQVQTHQRLSQALKLLYFQEPPNLYEDYQTKELEPLWWWTQEWAETFLERNETFLVRLRETGLDFPLPIQSNQPETQQAWIAEHDNFTLENWLSDLTYGMDR
jgi:hypothetical protein